MDKSPNILLLVNDHQTYYGHGKMAGGPKIQRPNFERVSNQGIEFIQAYTACPLCGPARRAMLTGLFPHNHGELMNEVQSPFKNETYLDILSKNGYNNYYYGKWHAGPGTAKDHNTEGFSYPKFGNPYRTPEYRAYLNENDLPNFSVNVSLSFYNPKWPRSKELGIEVGKSYSPKAKNYDESIFGLMETPRETHEAFFLANLACTQLEKIAKNENKQPFHMRVDFWGPHPPYFVSEEYLKLYNPKDIPIYPNFKDDLEGKPDIYQYDCYFPISENGTLIQPNPLPWSEWQKALAYAYAHTSLIDDAGGKILDTLEGLGLSENTIVIWTSDHGDGLACHGGHFDKDCYLPEELLRIPMAIRYPNQIPQGQRCEKLISNVDLGPTILDFAGTSFPMNFDGKSLKSICFNEDIPWREDIMVETHGHKHIHLGRALITERYKYVYNERYLDELYDLREDPYELNNLIENIDYKDKLIDLKKRLTLWRKKTNDNMTKRKVRKYILQNHKEENQD
jgi:arylsulfatase A-like enzyme